jgi:hypothetical protein
MYARTLANLARTDPEIIFRFKMVDFLYKLMIWRSRPIEKFIDSTLSSQDRLSIRTKGSKYACRYMSRAKASQC